MFPYLRSVAGTFTIQLTDSNGTTITTTNDATGRFFFLNTFIGAHTLRVLTGPRFDDLSWRLIPTQRAVLHDEDNLKIGVMVIAKNDTRARLALTWDTTTAAELSLDVAFHMPWSKQQCEVSESRPACGGASLERGPLDTSVAPKPPAWKTPGSPSNEQCAWGLKGNNEMGGGGLHTVDGLLVRDRAGEIAAHRLRWTR